MRAGRLRVPRGSGAGSQEYAVTTDCQHYYTIRPYCVSSSNLQEMDLVVEGIARAVYRIRVSSFEERNSESTV